MAQSLYYPVCLWSPSLYGILTSQKEYPCWLLQSVLLQGYLYLTTKHVCFYAYLPKKLVSLNLQTSTWSNCSRMRSSSPDTFQNLVNGILNITGTGFAWRATSCHIIPTLRSCTFRAAISTCAMEYLPVLLIKIEGKTPLTSQSSRTNDNIISRQTVYPVPRTGSRPYGRSYFAPIMKVTASKSHYRSRISSMLRTAKL